MVLMTVLSPEESRNILAPLIACDVCPRQISGLWTAEPILPKERLHGIFARLVRGLMVAYEYYELPSATNVDVLRAVDASGRRVCLLVRLLPFVDTGTR